MEEFYFQSPWFAGYLFTESQFFLSDLAYIHLFYIILSYFSLSWIFIQFLEESHSSDM